jgi:signal transduction histidine kinase
MEPVELDPTQGVWTRATSENRAILLAEPIENPQLKAHFEALGVSDLMIAAMHSEDAVNGLIEVRNRRGPQTFSAEDLKLFETLANHASIALENARLIDELEDSLVHLTEMNRLKDDFVASVSHELRTPLTSIQGYVKTLLREDAQFPPDQQRSFLETVDRQSNRLHRLIEDLLAVSRLESQSEIMSPSVISLEELAREVVEELRDKAGGHDVVFEFEDLPALESDEGKVHQILLNLVDNAFKYTPAGTTVTIQGRSLGKGATISVADQGVGIPAEEQDKVFDRFYQIDQTATRAVGGTGLGLYICRRMAEAIGGRVWLERSGPEGSVFSLWVPSTMRAPRPQPDTPQVAGDAGWKI